MFNFRFFPGVDFTQINLDWIIKKIGLLEAGQKTVEEAAEQATAAAEQATAAAETATEAAESAVEQIETVVDTANEAKQIAQSANTTAGAAQTTANGALAQADIAREEAQTAQTTAEGAYNTSAVTTDNGYCKMPDGTLLCWGRVSVTRNLGANSARADFPVAFIDAPMILAAYRTGRPDLWYASVSDSQPAYASLVLYNNSGGDASGNGTIFYFATGRWKA